MTPEERERMAKIVAQIEVEKDTDKFSQLIEELNSLIDQKTQRLNKGPSPGPKS